MVQCEQTGFLSWHSKYNVVLGRIVRAAAIERLFDTAKGMDLRIIFATVCLFDHYYMEYEILQEDFDDVILTVLVALAVIVMDDPC